MASSWRTERRKAMFWEMSAALASARLPRDWVKLRFSELVPFSMAMALSPTVMASTAELEKRTILVATFIKKLRKD